MCTHTTCSLVAHTYRVQDDTLPEFSDQLKKYFSTTRFKTFNPPKKKQAYRVSVAALRGFLSIN